MRAMRNMAAGLAWLSCGVAGKMALGGDLVVSRGVEVGALLLVFDDPVTDGDSAEAAGLGPFSAELDAFVTLEFSSAAAQAGQAGVIDVDGFFDVSGFATSGLYVQGLADSSGLSTVRVEFDVADRGRLYFDDLLLTVDDALGADFSFDRPAAAWAEVRVEERGTGSLLYAARIDLDGSGTRLEFADRGGVPLEPGSYAMVIEAGSADATAGFEEILGSFGAAEFSVAGRVQAGCVADFAAPFGVLDLADVQAFVAELSVGGPGADLARPAGQLDLADIEAFVGSFLSGCP